MPLDWDCLEAFRVFAEHLSFTHAAKACHLSQPALHARIRRLSESLGRPLYVRRGQQIALTPDGQKVEAFARDLKVRRDAFMDSLTGTQTRRPAVLSAGEGAYLYLLGPAIKRFSKRDRIRLLVGRPAEILDHVQSGKADVGVLGTDPDLPEDLESEDLAKVEQVLALPKDHPLANQTCIRPQDLAGETLVMPPKGRPQRTLLDRVLEGIDYDVAVEATGWPLVMQLVSLGAGLAVINGFCTPPRGVVTRPFDGLPQQTYVAVRRRDGASLPAADRLWLKLVS